jgi:hypothetical protein
MDIEAILEEDVFQSSAKLDVVSSMNLHAVTSNL